MLTLSEVAGCLCQTDPGDVRLNGCSHGARGLRGEIRHAHRSEGRQEMHRVFVPGTELLVLPVRPHFMFTTPVGADVVTIPIL